MTDPDFDDLDLFPEPVKYPKGPLINGKIVQLDPGYAREVQVGQPLLAGVLAFAGVLRAFGWLIISLWPGGTTPGSVWRNWKGLRKGPEYQVTPVRLRDNRGNLCEVEIHGYFSPTALQRGDPVRGRVRPQRDRQLPPRVERLANLATGQVLRPSPPNLWSHLGPALLLQAMFGGILLTSLLLCGIIRL